MVGVLSLLGFVACHRTGSNGTPGIKPACKEMENIDPSEVKRLQLSPRIFCVKLRRKSHHFSSVSVKRYTTSHHKIVKQFYPMPLWICQSYSLNKVLRHFIPTGSRHKLKHLLDPYIGNTQMLRCKQHSTHGSTEYVCFVLLGG